MTGAAPHATTSAPHAAAAREVETDIPARLDRLPWSGFHWLVIVALGITWVLDGLEVTLVGSLSGAIAGDKSLGISDADIGFAASGYLTGAIVGALGFGHLTDRLGRKKLFLITVAVYAVGTIATALSWDFASFALFRCVTGLGIGGEYAAINSAIDELIPARRRGWTDLAVNGSFWIGAAIGAAASLIVLDPSLVPPAVGWRGAFAIGGVLGFSIMLLRRHVPESPRWLMVHGRIDEAEAVVSEIEARAGAPPAQPAQRIRLRLGERLSLWRVGRAVAKLYPRRLLLGLVLMAAQAFFYNAIFFTYALVLGRFYGVPSGRVGLYMLAFAGGNFFGPLLLGHFFDTIGRKRMITATYGVAALLMAVTAVLFAQGWLDAA
ncbi:MAG TPA: MFS transporter [Stellaceae bacterium]|nr:MFS transporter [Stellaceae bacterium]